MKPEFVFLIVWAIGMIVVWPVMIWRAIQSRRARNEPLFPKPPASARYVDRSASGRQRGKLGGASNCLMVVVADGHLWLSAPFPITVMMPYGCFGLEFRKHINEVAVEPRRDWQGMNVRLTLRGVEAPTVIDLRVRDPASFIEALRP